MDLDRIRDKLDELHRYVEDLREDLPSNSKEYVHDRKSRRASEKDFELACDSLIDICNIIISDEELGRPTDHKDSLNKLTEGGILNSETASSLKDMLGFRNLLVHRYGKIDHEKAFNYLSEETKNFKEFAKEIQEFIKSQ
ncbi:hypothetical protein AKJ65_00855 [candidate division MSBL1 archaeon SCGC-AAA259E19]|uniref:DUF86 domain-containing protein n=1 Tax=candidate division MSBL1 archaeon SCGC-AAA259E19 TaxID=1698264 RepID=A0A133UNP2_9EURY|nr:hypothetical protein AKJ65_00855 [candidate division MSBL1 archaeon SCGC-AAA259E19]